jgi:hypothetical protein
MLCCAVVGLVAIPCDGWQYDHHIEFEYMLERKICSTITAQQLRILLRHSTDINSSFYRNVLGKVDVPKVVHPWTCCVSSQDSSLHDFHHARVSLRFHMAWFPSAKFPSLQLPV